MGCDTQKFRLCAGCKVEFTPGRGGTHSRAKYCSRSCSDVSRKKIRICGHCGKQFTRWNKNQPKFCSDECFAIGRKRGTRRSAYTCAKCDKVFLRYATQVSGDKVYCSKACMGNGRTLKIGPDHPLWRGGTCLINGYAYELDYNSPKPAGGFSHRAVHVKLMEREIGRKIVLGEVVHHLNSDRLDNRLENLVLMTNKEHRAVHNFYGSEYQREHEAAGDLRDKTLAFLATLRK